MIYTEGVVNMFICSVGCWCINVNCWMSGSMNNSLRVNEKGVVEGDVQ